MYSVKRLDKYQTIIVKDAKVYDEKTGTTKSVFNILQHLESDPSLEKNPALFNWYRNLIRTNKAADRVVIYLEIIEGIYA